MNVSRRSVALARRVRSAVALLVTALGVAAACGGATSDPGTDSNTHWLSACESDAQCGGLSCICGKCMRSCDSDAGCAGFSGARCTTPNDCSLEPLPTACIVPCSDDRDCVAVRDGLSCVRGQCRLRDKPSECLAMQVEFVPNSPSPRRRYWWNGRFCEGFGSAECVGSDCSRLFATIDECDRAYDACYQAEGMARECSDDSECALDFRGCCPTCTVGAQSQVIGVRADSLPRTHLEPFCHLGCVECAGGDIDPNLVPTCSEGRCVARLPVDCAGRDQASCAATPYCHFAEGTRWATGGEPIYVGCLYWLGGYCSENYVCAHAPGDPSDCLQFGNWSCVPEDWELIDSCSLETCPAAR